MSWLAARPTTTVMRVESNRKGLSRILKSAPQSLNLRAEPENTPPGRRRWRLSSCELRPTGTACEFHCLTGRRWTSTLVKNDSKSSWRRR